MDKIFEQAKDQHVAGVKIYKKASDVYAYSDSSKTLKIDADVLEDLYFKGLFVVDGDNIYRPVGLNVDAGVATITYVTADTTTATTAVLATLVSSEYTAG